MSNEIMPPPASSGGDVRIPPPPFEMRVGILEERILLTAQEHRVLLELRSAPGIARSVDELIELAGMEPERGRPAESLLESLMVRLLDYGFPIVRTRAGKYFWPRTMMEGLKANNSLEIWIWMMLGRAERQKKNLAAWFSPQNEGGRE